MRTRAPRIESRGMDLTSVQEWRDGETRRFQDYLVREEPLEIRIGKYPLSVTMRTPGNDLDLAAGFLFTEGLIRRREDIQILEHTESCKPSEAGNVVRIEVAGDVTLEFEHTQRKFFAASSCGICGKASIDSVRLRGLRSPKQRLHLDPEVLCNMPDALRSAQAIFGRTGGLHAAGLFDARGQLVVQREDVGRHNAVDKVYWLGTAQRAPSALGICAAGKWARRLRDCSEGDCRWSADRRFGFGAVIAGGAVSARDGTHPYRIPPRETIRRVFR
jgi:FdhD protein